MHVHTRVLAAEAEGSPLGRILLAGEVDGPSNDVPRPFRTIDDAYVFSYVFGGAGRYTHASGVSEPISPGTVLVLRPGVPHWYGTEAGGAWRELYVVCTGALFDTLAAEVLPVSGPHRPTTVPSPQALRTLLQATPRSARGSSHQLLELADWLVDALCADDGVGPSPPIAEAARLLGDDLSATIELTDLARRVGMEYATFRRRFTHEIGTPPLAFRNGHRLRAAATLLWSTDMTLRQIAGVLGYADEFHLSKRFRAQFGESPTRYRTGRR